MAKEAYAKLTDVGLGNKTVEIKIYDGDEVLGTVLVGKASLIWRPKNKKKGFRLAIEDVGDLAEEHGAPE